MQVTTPVTVTQICQTASGSERTGQLKFDDSTSLSDDDLLSQVRSDFARWEKRDELEAAFARLLRPAMKHASRAAAADVRWTALSTLDQARNRDRGRPARSQRSRPTT